MIFFTKIINISYIKLIILLKEFEDIEFIKSNSNKTNLLNIYSINLDIFLNV